MLAEYIVQRTTSLNSNMPGHIKLVKGAADLDSTEYLLPSIKLKHADRAEPYNTKKGSWIPNPNTRNTGKDVKSLEILKTQHLIVSYLWPMESLPTKALELARLTPTILGRARG